MIAMSAETANAAIAVRIQLHVACRSALKLDIELRRNDTKSAFRTLKQGATALIAVQTASEMLRGTALHDQAVVMVQRARDAMGLAFAQAWPHFPRAVDTLVAQASV